MAKKKKANVQRNFERPLENLRTIAQDHLKNLQENLAP